MITVMQGFPEYIHGIRAILIPRPIKEYKELMDIGSVTAHEIGHAVLRHRPGITGKKRVEKEVEAWMWAVSRRGLTKADREYLYDELLQDALDEGFTEEEFADLLLKVRRRQAR